MANFNSKNILLVGLKGDPGEMSNPMTAQADIIVGDASGTPTRMAKGTAGQVLKVNTSANGLEWESVKTINSLSLFGNGNIEIDGSYANSVTVEWNKEIRAGNSTPAVTIPAIPLDKSGEIRYTFTAASANASFTAPNEVYLGDDDGFGTSTGNTIAYTDLTAGSIYEVSIAVIDTTHIGILMKEWA